MEAWSLLMNNFIPGIVLIDLVYWLYSIFSQVNHFLEAPTVAAELNLREHILNMRCSDNGPL